METNDTKTNHAFWKRRIGLVLISQNLSLFGSSVVGFATLWYITLETSSGLWMMLSTISSTLPQLFISLWSGVWADRYNRKVLIMLSDAFIALSTLALAIAFLMGFHQIELILAVLAFRSIGAGIQTPAVNAIYPQITPQDKLVKVQGINQTCMSVLMLLSPAVGGMVLASMGIVWTFMLDVITALLSIAVLSFIRVDTIERADEPESAFSDLKKGFLYVFRHSQLRRIVIAYGIAFILITPAAVLSPLLVERTFGSDVWRLSANEIVWAVGSVLGGVYVSLRGQFQNKIRVMIFCLVMFGLCFSLMGFAYHFILFLAIMGIAGIFMPVIATASTVYIQEIAEPSMMGRVFSILQIIGSAAIPIAILFFGPLADAVSVQAILFVSGVFLALLGMVYHIAEKRAAKDPAA